MVSADSTRIMISTQSLRTQIASATLHLISLRYVRMLSNQTNIYNRTEQGVNDEKVSLADEKNRLSHRVGYMLCDALFPVCSLYLTGLVQISIYTFDVIFVS